MTLLLIANSLSLVINFRFDLIKAIQDKGYTVHVATPDCNDLDLAKLEDQGVIFHQVSMSRSGLNPFQDLQTLWLLFRLIKKIQPDKVFAYSIKPVVYGMLAGFLSQVPSRYSLISGLGYAFVDDGQESAKRSLVNLMARFLYRISLNRCHQVFFQNPDDEQLFRQLSILRPQTPSMVVNGSGVNLQHFYPQPLPEQPVFLLVARLLSDKGIRE